MAEAFEIIAVDDGSKDRTRRSQTVSPPSTRTSSGSCTTTTAATAAPSARDSRPALELLLHRRGPPVPVRRHRPPHRAPAEAGPARRRRRLPDRRADPVIRIVYARAYSWPTASSTASGSATWTGPASCSGARPSRASGWSRGAFFSAELLIKIQRRAAPSSRSACRTTRGRRLADGREAVRHLARGQGLLGLRLRLWANGSARDAAAARSSAGPGRGAWAETPPAFCLWIERVHELPEEVEPVGSSHRSPPSAVNVESPLRARPSVSSSPCRPRRDGRGLVEHRRRR